MSFLRLGISCVVVNEQGQVLLSKRGDLRLWSIPGGRLDKGERFIQAAAREVREETGADVQVERFIGLYYLKRWQRLIVLSKARYLGGKLLGKSYEALANEWFSPDAIPNPIDPAHSVRIKDALTSETFLRIEDTPPAVYRKQRLTFALRWIANILNGQPEPRHNRFDVFGAAVIWDEAHKKVFAPHGRLPYIDCHGETAPWVQLNDEYTFLLGNVDLRWVGLWYHMNAIHFAFAATAPGNEYFHDPESLKLNKIEKAFIERVTPDYKSKPVWALSPDLQELTMSIK